MNNKRGNNLKEEPIGKRLLEQLKEALIKDDEAQVTKIAGELDTLIPNDKLADISALTIGFVTLYHLHTDGLIKELNIESIERAILERLSDSPKSKTRRTDV